MQQPAGNPDGRDSEAPTVQFPAPDFSAAAAERRDTDPVAASAGPDGRPGRSGDRERDGRREQDPDREHSADREQGPDREHSADREQSADRERDEQRDRPPPAEWDPLAHGGAAGWRTVLGVLLVLGGVLGAMLLVLAMLRAPTPPPQPAAAQAP
ncbi:hypothetical protein, partial [Actinocatenispora comari]|uniref:hypothetical protein n=1 Tax=Actinocatenispora comari TaxID=2807577 RepID=UPI001A91F905